MNDALNPKEMNQLSQYKNGLIQLLQKYYTESGGTDAHMILENTIFPDNRPSEELYQRAVSKHTNNRIVKNLGKYALPEITPENQFIFDQIKWPVIPFDIYTIDSLIHAYQRLKPDGEHLIQSLGFDITAEAIWLLFNTQEPEHVRCLALPKEAYPDCLGYVDHDEIKEMTHFEIRDWHRIPEVVAHSYTAVTDNSNYYLFDMLMDSDLDISYEE